MAGRYRLAFDADCKGEYRVTAQSNQEYYTLSHSLDGLGAETRRGVTNTIDFEVTHYRTLTITANTSKNGKNSVDFFFIAWDQQGDDYRNIFFSDTIRSNQRVALTRTVKVLPHRRYRFVKMTYNRVLTSPNQAAFRDEVWEDQYRNVLDNDTTVITFR